MKILLFILSLVSFFNLSSNNYKTNEEKFLDNIHSAYDTYYVHNLDNACGDLILVIGNIDNLSSFSLYFKNKVSNSYNVEIYDIKKDKSYVLSNYEDFQIYYNIPIANDKDYNIEIKSQNNQVYMKYKVSLDTSNYNMNDISLVNGLSNNDFPYTTKLQNKMSSTTLYLIVGIIFIIVEIVIFILVRRKNRKMKENTSVDNNNNKYQTLNYVVIDSKKVDDDEK